MEELFSMLFWFFGFAIAYGSIGAAGEAFADRAYLKFFLLLIFGLSVAMIVLATGLEFVFE
ncbi:hypothetical protein [Moraxella pluranimalium]|uniref:Uncharacterized protein n=1 Tax=Moraxella pluranimalium TaxID=470453 RepID=A0A1T0CPI4_9GAMM|nr:hypothetical protein [Moraxella pluranimalium]OOS24169.1 hypothetical protein B0680_05135 [Moraxella pluranimalium]